jgi:predicted ATP-grasp superfamily ATP-dependent carboligase
MFDENGAVCLLEINARPSLSSVVSIAVGVPLLDDLISIAQNNPIPELAITEPRLVVPYRAMARAQND